MMLVAREGLFLHVVAELSVAEVNGGVRLIVVAACKARFSTALVRQVNGDADVCVGCKRSDGKVTA